MDEYTIIAGFESGHFLALLWERKGITKITVHKVSDIGDLSEWEAHSLTRALDQLEKFQQRQAKTEEEVPSDQ